MRVTITGADDAVDPMWMAGISKEYPFVEWGILCSVKRMGEPRYPSQHWVRAVQSFEWGALGLSLHLCGKWSRDFIAGDFTDTSMYQRVQLNGYDGPDNKLDEYRGESELILQTRDTAGLRDATQQCRHLRNASILFDPSGGRGKVTIDGFPTAPQGVRYGVAGGIGPDNILLTMSNARRAHASWIDMESSVRDSDDRFDTELVSEVLELAKAGRNG